MTVKLLLVVPKSLRLQVMAAHHDNAMHGGHMDAGRTCARIRSRFWWGRMYSDIFDYARSCLTCRTATKRTTGVAPLGLHATPSRPFEYLAMDLLAMPESAAGNKYAMVVVDHFSRYVIVVPLPDKRSATVAAALLQRVVLIHGAPKELLSDQGGEFDSEVMEAVC